MREETEGPEGMEDGSEASRSYANEGTSGCSKAFLDSFLLYMYHIVVKHLFEHLLV